MRFSEQLVDSVSPDDISTFLEEWTEGVSRSRRHLRYAQMKAFFNYIIEATGMNIKNPCNTVSLSKTFRMAQQRPRKILDKEIVDEIIFKSRDNNYLFFAGSMQRTRSDPSVSVRAA